jgi:hypothetical protein
VGGFLPDTVGGVGLQIAHIWQRGCGWTIDKFWHPPLVNLLPNDFTNCLKGHSAEGLSASSTRNSTFSDSDFVFART